MNLTLLKTPPQDRFDSPYAEWRTQDLEAWIESLPRGDAEAFSAAVHGLLLSLNRTRLKRLQRSEVMERLRPIANDACAMLIGQFRHSPLPLSSQQQSAADRVQQIYAELATGFKIVVNDAIDSYAAGKGNPDLLQFAIQRALLSLGRALLGCYRIYAPEPPLLWRDIHTLFRNGEQARLQNLPFYGTPDTDETALTIKQAYLRIAVLALANPYHLMQGEADELYPRIGRWVHFVQLLPAASQPAGVFAIDLNSDLPARYLPHRAPATPGSSDLRVLDLSRLIAAVSEQIDAANALLAARRSGESLSTRLQRDMYIRFRAALSDRGERRSERKPTLARLVAVRGLTAAHFLLNDRQPFAPEEDKDARQDPTSASSGATTLSLLEDWQQAPAHSGNGSRASRFVGIDPDADDVWRRATLATPPPEPMEYVPQPATPWNRKNESEGGLALFCAKDSPMQLRVGELLAYADTDDAPADQWRIGATRWLRTRPNGGLELGVQKLADNGHAVAVQAISGPGTGSEHLRGILIPRINPIARMATLLTPASFYDVGTVLRLQMQDLVLQVRLTELLEATRLFAHFRFKLVKQEPRGDRPIGP